MKIYPKEVSALRIFGSAARGDVDSFSDHDLLAVVPVVRADTKDFINQRIPGLCQKGVSTSVYGEGRIRELFEEGSLFAWHLYLESARILEGSDFLDRLGAPAKYSKVQFDLSELVELALSIHKESCAKTRATVYESGLLYLVARNAAIVCSNQVTGEMLFGRYAPFDLERRRVTRFPLDRGLYDRLFLARRESIEGRPLGGGLSPSDLAEVAKMLISWLKGLNRMCSHA